MTIRILMAPFLSPLLCFAHGFRFSGKPDAVDLTHQFLAAAGALAIGVPAANP
jgi:hypothetical protein